MKIWGHVGLHLDLLVVLSNVSHCLGSLAHYTEPTALGVCVCKDMVICIPQVWESIDPASWSQGNCFSGISACRPWLQICVHKKKIHCQPTHSHAENELGTSSSWRVTAICVPGAGRKEWVDKLERFWHICRQFHIHTIAVIIGNVSGVFLYKGAILLSSGCYNKFKTLVSNSKLIHSSGNTKKKNVQPLGWSQKLRASVLITKTIEENTSLSSCCLRRYQYD